MRRVRQAVLIVATLAGCWLGMQAVHETGHVLGALWTGGRVALHVRDDGPGLDERVRAHLFEPFLTSHAKGTGLGLYIARELAEANDARLEAGADGAGAEFVLTGRS